MNISMLLKSENYNYSEYQTKLLIDEYNFLKNKNINNLYDVNLFEIYYENYFNWNFEEYLSGVQIYCDKHLNNILVLSLSNDFKAFLFLEHILLNLLNNDLFFFFW